MWAIEKDAALRSDFCNLTILDRMPDLDRLRDRMRHAITAIPHLGERVVTPPLRLAPPEWRTDAGLDLDYHVRSLALPEPASLRDLLDLAATLCATPFDRSRPLWEFTVIDGLAGGHAALLQKVHHTITDGVGGLPGTDQHVGLVDPAIGGGEGALSVHERQPRAVAVGIESSHVQRAVVQRASAPRAVLAPRSVTDELVHVLAVLVVAATCALSGLPAARLAMDSEIASTSVRPARAPAAYSPASPR